MNANMVKLTVDTTSMHRRNIDVQKEFVRASEAYDLALCADASYKDGIASVGITDGSERFLYRVDNYIDHNVAELLAIMQSLRLALTQFRHPKRLLIGSDSLSVLKGFANGQSLQRTDQYTVALSFVLALFYEPCEITLMWVPGHKGIRLNEIADENACLARQLPDDSVIEFPLALWNQKTRWTRRNPSDLLHYQPGSTLARHRDADNFLRGLKLGQSILNVHNGVPGHPQFSWCEFCLQEDGSKGRKQTPEHIFMECPALSDERAKLRTEFLAYGIPYRMTSILCGYCIEEIAYFFERIQALKASFVV